MQMRWLKCTLVWTFLLAACQVVVVGQTAPVGAAVQSALNEARAAYRQQDLPAAKRALAKVLALDATQSEAFFLTAMIAVQEKNNGKALKSAKEAVRLQPRYPHAQGITQVRVLGGAGKLAGPIYNKGYSIKDGTKSLTCTPAKKNGEVVPFWYRWEDAP